MHQNIKDAMVRSSEQDTALIFRTLHNTARVSVAAGRRGSDCFLPGNTAGLQEQSCTRSSSYGTETWRLRIQRCVASGI